MQKFLSLIVILVFSGNVLFGQIQVVLYSTDVNCAGGCNGFIHAEAYGGTAPYTFNWTGLPPFQDQFNVCAGNYTCIVTDANSLVGYNQVTITEPLPLVVSSSSTNDNGTGNGTASVIVSGGTPTFIYQWGANASNQTTATATGLSSGMYIVTVIDANDCVKIDTVEVLLGTGITITESNFNYSIYPNPVKNELNLKITNKETEDISVVIYNSIGEIILTKNITLASGDNLQNYNLQNIISGIYFIEIKGIKNLSYLKFVKTE